MLPLPRKGERDLALRRCLATGIAIGFLIPTVNLLSQEPASAAFAQASASPDVAAKQRSRAVKTNIPYSDAEPILAVLRDRKSVV